MADLVQERPGVGRQAGELVAADHDASLLRLPDSEYRVAGVVEAHRVRDPHGRGARVREGVPARAAIAAVRSYTAFSVVVRSAGSTKLKEKLSFHAVR